MAVRFVATVVELEVMPGWREVTEAAVVVDVAGTAGAEVANPPPRESDEGRAASVDSLRERVRLGGDKKARTYPCI